MNFAFFSDDVSGIHAALLANIALNRDRPADPGILSADGNAGTVESHFDAARETDRHGFVALPLAALSDLAIRRRLDLAIVTAGPSLVAQGIARRVVASEARWPRPHIVPAWLLTGQPHPPTTDFRRLPVSVVPLRLDETIQLRAGCSCGTLHRRAVGLAAALRIAVDDPCADGIDPAEIADLLMPDRLHAAPACPTRRLREDLLDLAADLDDGPLRLPPAMDRRRGPALARGHCTRDRHRTIARAPYSPATRHEPDCAYANGK